MEFWGKNDNGFILNTRFNRQYHHLFEQKHLLTPAHTCWPCQMSHQEVSLHIHVYIKKCIKSTFFFSDGDRTQVTIRGPEHIPQTVQRRNTGPDLVQKHLISYGVPSSPSVTTSVCSLIMGRQTKKKVPNVNLKRT